MRKDLLNCIVIFFALFISASFSFAGEREIVVSLEKIRASLNTGVSKEKLDQLLIDAEAEINIAEGESSASNKFIEKAKETHKNFAAGNFFFDLGKMSLYELRDQQQYEEHIHKANEHFTQGNEHLKELYKLMRHKK